MRPPYAQKPKPKVEIPANNKAELAEINKFNDSIRLEGMLTDRVPRYRLKTK